MSFLSLTGRTWIWPKPLPKQEIQGETTLPWWAEVLLERRGIQEDEAINKYLQPSLSTLDDPLIMAGMHEALERITKAIQNNEHITVYGDYDVDGVCSSSTLVEFLQKVGAKTSFYIPDRRREGYGLNLDAVKQIAQESQLLITTDCGINANQEITWASQNGLDVIVVDHHQVPETLPPAIACLNPHRPDCAYPFKDLCAAGVAFMLVLALRRHLRDKGHFDERPEPDVRELLDIVALATVADMVPIHGTNRILVAAGLKRLRQNRRVGLAALCRVSNTDVPRMGATDLGFKLGPRINARGRVAHAAQAVDLMLTHDPERAQTLAAALEHANQKRKLIEQETLEEALVKVEAQKLHENASIVVHAEHWHPGVLGLVASKLVSRYHLPAIVIGEGGKGSGRTVNGLNLYQAMKNGSDSLLGFGGHPAAAGLTIEPKNIPNFYHDFSQAVVTQLGEPPFYVVLEPDLEVESQTINFKLIEQLEKLEPFGQGNPEPLLVMRNVEVQSKRLVGEKHLKLSLGQKGLDAIAFDFGTFMHKIPDKVDVAFHVERNVFRGNERLQLRIRDIRSSEE